MNNEGQSPTNLEQRDNALFTLLNALKVHGCADR